MSSRKATRARQSRKKLLASLWAQLDTPGIDPETAIRLTKQITKLESPNPARPAVAKDTVEPAGRRPKAGLPVAWLVPDENGVRWAVVYALERLAGEILGLSAEQEAALDAWIASLDAATRAELEVQARELATGSPPSPAAQLQQ